MPARMWLSETGVEPRRITYKGVTLERQLLPHVQQMLPVNLVSEHWIFSRFSLTRLRIGSSY